VLSSGKYYDFTTHDSSGSGDTGGGRRQQQRAPTFAASTVSGTVQQASSLLGR
jgi:hypothetical protein